MPLQTTMIEKMKNEAMRSSIYNKHACIAMIGNKIISPIFHNYTRHQVFGNVCGSIHSEMSAVNYLINNICRGESRKNRQYILQTYKRKENK